MRCRRRKGTLVRMNPRRVASIAAVVGGVGWLVKVGLVWLSGGDAGGGLVNLMYDLGFAAFAVALAAAGYTLVEKAPVWLRAVVAVATPLLVLMVWLMLDPAIRTLYPGDSWLHEEVSDLVAGVIALVLGLWEQRRAAAMAPPPDPRGARRAEPPVRGRRAAR